MYRIPSVLIRKAFRPSLLQKHRHFSALSEKRVSVAVGEYSDEPEYPRLFDPSCLGKRRHARHQWYERIRAMPTVEEKMLAITKGFFCKDGKDIRISVCILTSLYELYNTLPFQLNCTRTELIRGGDAKQLIAADQLHANEVRALVQRVKPRVLDAIRDVYGGAVPLNWDTYDETIRRHQTDRDKLNGQRMIDYIYRVVSLEANLQHLHESQVDYNPRCDAFWIKGDFPPNSYTKNKRKNLLKKYPGREQPDEPVDIWFQYVGTPYMQIRSELPLPEVVQWDNPICTEVKVPEFPYDPVTIGYKFHMRNATSVPGFWPADPSNFGLLSFYTRQRGLVIEQMFGKEATRDAIHGLGVVASFAWLASLATHNGFTPFNEITYPMTTQTVITNGHLWSFYLYQLNTLTLGMDFEKTHRNVCWATEEQKLFETVEGGEVKGFNEDVLETLVTFITRKPREVNFNLRPYLRKSDCGEADMEKIRHEYKDRYSNRPLPNNQPETPLWEKIYKKKFQAKIE